MAPALAEREGCSEVALRTANLADRGQRLLWGQANDAGALDSLTDLREHYSSAEGEGLDRSQRTLSVPPRRSTERDFAGDVFLRAADLKGSVLFPQPQ